MFCDWLKNVTPYFSNPWLTRISRAWYPIRGFGSSCDTGRVLVSRFFRRLVIEM